jgi:hypothetical protein
MTRSGFAIVLLFCCAMSIAGEHSMQLVGQPRLQVLFWPVYDSRLFSHDGDYREGQRPLRLEIEYLRDVASSKLVENTDSEWQQLPGVPAYSEQWLQALSQLWPDVTAGDVLALELDESGSSTFFVNGEPLGSIEDPAFGQHFLDIWLSPNTSRPKLRLALIGEK